MTQSWTNDSVQFSIINKDLCPTCVPVLNQEVLWSAGDNKSAFAFGGEQSWLLGRWMPPEVDLWQLTSDGKGGGDWSMFNVGNNPSFGNLTRPDSALAATVDGTGFILGGIENSHSSYPMENMTGQNALGGIVAFNMTSNEWSNTSMPSDMVRPLGKNGILASVPIFGPEGLLLAAGTGTIDQDPTSFETITIYEPGGKTWHNQTSTGIIPKGRDKACAVGIQGDNGTYEMYVDIVVLPHIPYL